MYFWICMYEFTSVSVCVSSSISIARSISISRLFIVMYISVLICLSCYINMYIYICICIHLYLDRFMYLHLYLYIHIHVHVHVHMHIHRQGHMHRHIHTYMYMNIYLDIHPYLFPHQYRCLITSASMSASWSIAVSTSTYTSYLCVNLCFQDVKPELTQAWIQCCKWAYPREPGQPRNKAKEAPPRSLSDPSWARMVPKGPYQSGQDPPCTFCWQFRSRSMTGVFRTSVNRNIWGHVPYPSITPIRHVDHKRFQGWFL